MRQHIRVSGLNTGHWTYPGPLFRCFALLCAIALTGVLSGCAIAISLPSALTGEEEDVTGSIGKGSPLGPTMDQEDWRRASAALGVALDPQGNGAPVLWSNPQTGAKGSFVQTGKPYPAEAVVCRPFSADVTLKSGEHALAGRACVDKAGEWTVKESKPRKKS